MNKKEQLKYATYFLRHNVFNTYEIDYYKGLLHKKPRRISDKIWKKAFEKVDKIHIK